MTDKKKQDAAQSNNTESNKARENAEKQNGKDDSRKSVGSPDYRDANRSEKKLQTSDPLLVGIGASAGGLDPIFQIIEQLEPDTPCAYFIVQHQAMDSGDRLLSSLLEKRTACEVQLAEDGVRVQSGVIYVAPPNKLLAIEAIHIRLQDRKDRTMAIDHLVRSLATAAGERSVAVILSGSNTDGTLGARAIMENGGIVIAQNPESAEYSTMPQSVIDSGFADLVLDPSDIPAQLRDYADKLDKRHKSDQDTLSFPRGLHEKLIMEVKDRVGHDFSAYKDNTINRRIQRRMDFHKIERFKDYVALVQSDQREARDLFKDMLISVTNFFRDPACFEALKQTLIKDYLPQKSSSEFRAWVPGCATGEEAYSLAIVLAEAMAEADVHCAVSIYATDVDTEAIASARTGVFPENIEADVSEQRLRRFFTHQNNQYRIKQKIRDMLVFAEQNVRQDPPFYRLDIIVCRNLLIYFKPEAQQKVLSHFCYALKRNGLLMLGTSENVGQHGEYLRSIDTHCRLYAAKRGIEDHERDFDNSGRSFSTPAMRKGRKEHRRSEDFTEESGVRSMERIILNVATPPSIIVNRHGDIHFIHGRTGKLLEPAQGKPDANILSMAREGLRMDLTTLLSECARSQKEQHHRNVRVRTNGDEALFDIAIHPVRSDHFETPMFLIAFHESNEPVEGVLELPDMEGVSDTARKRIAVLGTEVQECRDSMRIMTEEYEAANEELKSANEELQSTNEELKSTVEELETAKEEVQSINEEQATLNAELQDKNDELKRISSDLDNLMVSTEIATLFLNSDLEIKRYTPAMMELMSLRESDLGRPVTDIAMKLDYADLAKDAARVQKQLEPITRELAMEDNAWLQMRIRPYKTTDNRIDGVVVTFIDITQLKISERAAQSAQNLAESIIEISSAPILVLDEDMIIRSTNGAFLDAFGVTEKKTLGRHITEAVHGRLGVPALMEALTTLVQEKELLRNHPVDAEIEPSRKVRLIINAKFVPFSTTEGEARRILMSIADIKPLDKED